MPKTPPQGYHTVTPYLIVDEPAKLIEFLKGAFDGQETERMARPDGAIMHAEVKIGDSLVMMGGSMPQFQAMPCGLYVYVPDVDAVYRQAIEAGAASVSEPRDEFYGDRVGGVKDPCGNIWWIGTRKEDVSKEELVRRAQAMFSQQHKA